MSADELAATRARIEHLEGAIARERENRGSPYLRELERQREDIATGLQLRQARRRRRGRVVASLLVLAAVAEALAGLYFGEFVGSLVFVVFTLLWSALAAGVGQKAGGVGDVRVESELAQLQRVIDARRREEGLAAVGARVAEELRVAPSGREEEEAALAGTEVALDAAADEARSGGLREPTVPGSRDGEEH